MPAVATDVPGLDVPSCVPCVESVIGRISAQPQHRLILVVRGIEIT